MAEHLEVVFVLELAGGGELQLEQRVLSRVHIDRVDFLGLAQGVVDGIAPGGGDNHNRIGWLQFKRLAIEPRIFPTGVVDQIVAMNESKDASANPFLQGHRFGWNYL